MSDAEQRGRYDAQGKFFSSMDALRGQHIDTGNIRGAAITEVAELLSALQDDNKVWVLHVYSDQRHYMGGFYNDLPPEVGVGHININLAEQGVLDRLDVRRFPCFYIGFGGSVSIYFPGGWDMFNLGEAVMSAITPRIPYFSKVHALHSEADFDRWRTLRSDGGKKCFQKLDVLITVFARQ